MNKVEECSSIPLKVTVNVNGMRLPMEVDTGAAVSIISDATLKAMFPTLKIYRSNLLLKMYTEKQIPLVKNIHVHVKYGSQEAKLVLVIIQGDGPTLLGRNWLKYIKLDWNKIAVIHSTKPELWKY